MVKKPKTRFYKMIGKCMACKVTFIVDLDNRHSSRNYCKSCTAKFKKGGN